MKAVTGAEMKSLDQRAIEEYGIPSLLLMENAGRGIAGLISLEVARKQKDTANVLIFCGKGNNGGDGLAAARHLKNQGFGVDILLFSEPSELKPDPALNHRIATKMGIPIEIIKGAFNEKKFKPLIEAADYIVDALLGVGLEREVEEPYTSAIEAINTSGKKVIAIDIPSGLHADTGRVLGTAVRATCTAALGLPKTGFFMREGSMHIGELHVIDIGIPRDIYERV